MSRKKTVLTKQGSAEVDGDPTQYEIDMLKQATYLNVLVNISSDKKAEEFAEFVKLACEH